MSVPVLYANGFNFKIQATDLSIKLNYVDQPVVEVVVSHVIAKALGHYLGEALRVWEEQQGAEIPLLKLDIQPTIN